MAYRQDPYAQQQQQYQQYPQQHQQHQQQQYQQHHGGNGQYNDQQYISELPDTSKRTSLPATFVPGTDDGFFMPPEVISPSPQRIMPEVPTQITDSLNQLELEATSSNQHYSGGRPLTMDEPSFSHFPRLRNLPRNVPPSDEDRLALLEQERNEVLSSNDPDAQLYWAQSALAFVEVTITYLEREHEPRPRPATPGHEHSLKEDAMSVVQFLGEQEHPHALFIIGNWFEFGKFGYRIDKKEAFRCYSTAAEKGFARAEYRIGMQYENSNDYSNAVNHYMQGTSANDSASNYRLGMMTLLGQHGQKQDYARGVHYIRLAAQDADENAPQGAYVFGMLLARELPGITVPDMFLPQDIHLARQMIEKAAYLGFARAQLKMGMAYELCQLGCDFDPALSLHYNALASRRGEAEADMAISKWFLCGHEGVFDKNEMLAFKYAERAAAAALATAEFALGYFYEIGMYVNVDLQTAQEWYAKAASHGNKDASGRLDGISRSKTLSRKDHENVAVSRIRARHGSQRYSTNPLTDRNKFQQNLPSVPAEEPLDMPMPEIPQFQQPPQQQGVRPPRKSSMQPGPASFINPNLLQGQADYLQPRPGTTAPYPEHMGMGMDNGPIRRPNSASGYGTTQRPLSVASTAPRPSSLANIPPAGTRPTPQNFNGDSYDQSYDNGYGNQYNQPVQPLQPNRSPQLNGRGSTPAQIGFVAPADLPKPTRPGGGPRIGPNGPVRPSSTRPPASQQQQQPVRPGSTRPPQAQPARPGSTRPPANQGPGPARPGSTRPTPLQKPQQQQQVAPPQKSPAKPPAPSVSPAPGKGPKTFEEMGVPQAKQEGECVIM